MLFGRSCYGCFLALQELAFKRVLRYKMVLRWAYVNCLRDVETFLSNHCHTRLPDMVLAAPALRNTHHVEADVTVEIVESLMLWKSTRSCFKLPTITIRERQCGTPTDHSRYYGCFWIVW